MALSERIEPEFIDPALPEQVAEERVDAAREATGYKITRSGVRLRKTLFGWISRHERSLSAVSMIGGFAFDNYAYRRIDLPNTQALFIGYLTVAGVAIVLLHLFAARAAAGKPMPRWHSILPMATQFTLGALWSGFLIFYSRSAVLTESWPFLLVLMPTAAQADAALAALWTAGLGVSRLFVHALPDYAYLADRVPQAAMPHSRDFAQRALTISNSAWLDDADFERIHAVLGRASA